MGSAKMSRDQEMISFGRLIQQFAARGSRLEAMLAEGTVQVRLGDLDRVVNDVAQKDAGILAPRGADRDVAGRMSRRGKDREQLMDRLFARDELRLAALNDGEHAVFENIEKGRRLGRTILRSVARILLARKDVARIG